MKKIAFLAICASFAAPNFAAAGSVERACIQSSRGPSQALCRCIQDVADLTLTNGEQRAAARFFADPHQAQVVRQSSRSNDERFWLRYKNFGATAEAYCRV